MSTGAEREAEDDAMFYAFCRLRGLNPRLMRRPNMWWVMPREQWKPDWHENDIPKEWRK